MEEKQKDFKEVKVKITGGEKAFTETLSRSMLYSGVNIFGQLSELYLQSKDDFLRHTTTQVGQGTGDAPGASGQADGSSGMMSLNANVLQIFKKLQKRDPITKVKAFSELENYLDEVEAGSDELQNLLTFFLYHMCRILMNERDRKVREAAHQAFSAFIRRGKRKLGPHLKKIFPLWLCSFFDPSPEVSRLARQNFDAAFPQEKQGAVFKIVFKNFLHFANEQLQQSEDAIDDDKAKKEQAEDAFDRITSTVLLALGHSFNFIEEWPEEEKDMYRNKMLDILDLRIDAQPAAAEQRADEEEPPEEEGKEEEKQIDTTKTKRGRGKTKNKDAGAAAVGGVVAKKQPKQKYLWAFLSGNYRGRVRAACLQFVSTFLTRMPEAIVREHVSQITPLVYGLVSEQNSILQATLWGDALYTLGHSFPESWTRIVIKKDLLPKLNKTLKDAGYGAPVAMYKNFVKVVSVCPIYHLVPPTAAAAAEKTNKASFRDRCNLLRETMTSLYGGLQNDESVAFHGDLVAAFFETLAFVLWKRVQPIQVEVGGKMPVSEADLDFAFDTIDRIVQLPIADFVDNYSKFKTAAQNERNIHATIPSRFAKMLLDLALRDFNPDMYRRVCEVFVKNLAVEKRNSARLLAHVLKTFEGERPLPEAYRTIVVQTVFAKVFKDLKEQLTAEIPEAGKQTVDGIVLKITNYKRLLYTLNKHAHAAQAFTDASLGDITLPAGDLLVKVQKKEALAFKMLSREDLHNFAVIKTCLAESTVLAVNLGWESIPAEFTKMLREAILLPEKNPVQSLQQAAEKLERIVFLPETSFPSKVDFAEYFGRIVGSEDLHELLFEDMSVKMLQRDEIVQFKDLISASIEKQVRGQPSPVTEDDVAMIQSFISMVLGDKTSTKTAKLPFASLAAYFIAVKVLLKEEGDESNQELRELIVQQLLVRQVSTAADQKHFNAMWAIFAEAVRDKPEYRDQCIAKMQGALSELVTTNSKNLQGVAQFQHLTMLISKFVQLQKDKVGVLRQIVLVEDHFDNLEANPLPLKMFRDLFLDGSVNFDVSQLLHEKTAGGKFRFPWLIAKFLNFKHLVSLANFLELKNQLVIFVEADVLPALLVGDKALLVSLSETIADKVVAAESRDTAFSHQLTLEYLVQKVVDPGDDFPAECKPVLKLDEFKAIFSQVGLTTAKKLIETNFAGDDHDTRRVEILVKLLSHIGYYILEEAEVQTLYKMVKGNLTQALEAKADIGGLPLCKQQLQIFMFLARFMEQEEEQSVLFQISLLNYLLESQETCAEEQRLTLQHIGIELCGNLLASTTPKDQIAEKVSGADLHGTVIELLMSTSESAEARDAQALDCSTLIQLCQVIRKTMSWTENASTIVGMLVQAVKDRVAWFDERVQAQATQMSGGLQQLELEMLKEMAETLLICPSFITEETLKAHVEDNLYYIVGCRVEALQKASFVLLQFIYANFILPVEHVVTEEDELKQLKADFADILGDMNPKLEEETKEELKKDAQKAKADVTFKNVSQNLVELIDNAPPVISYDRAQEEAELQQQFAGSGDMLEKLVFGESQEGCLSNKLFGYLLAWNAMLAKIEQGRIKVQLSGETTYAHVLASLTGYLESNSPIYEMLLVSLVPFFPMMKKNLQDTYSMELSTFQPEYCELNSTKQSRLLCLHSLINFMKSFPSLARRFYQDCDRQILEITTPYIKQVVSPAIMENEIRKIEMSQLELGADNELSFVLFKSTKEIVATYNKSSEISVQIKLKIPAEYPLKSVAVDLSEQLKLKATQVRKWSLSIRNLIQSRNGDIISAILLWKSNIDKEMDGVEECFICYCVLHGTDKSLPSMQCKNCKNKFHVGCIRKWFNTSNKSNCPLCQTFFFQ